MKTLLIDNYDSFTHNVAHYLSEVNGEAPWIVKNDEFSYTELLKLSFDNVVISPGPGTPKNGRDMGVCTDVILRSECPILGICLGFQGIAVLLGCDIQRAPEAWHGRGSWITHDGSELFKGVPSPFFAIRYHSLHIPTLTNPDLAATAHTEDGILMALRHVRRPLWGVQFHPESISTEHGIQIFKNFRDLSHVRQAFAVGIASEGIERRVSPKPKIVVSAHRQKVRFQTVNSAPTPEMVFQALYANRAPSVWLDSSSESVGMSRFSFIADASHPSDYIVRYRSRSQALEIERHGVAVSISQNIFEFLKSELTAGAVINPGLPFPFSGGFIGYFGYELKAECGGQQRHHSNLPDAYFLRVSRFLAFDLETGDCFVVATSDDGDEDVWIAETVKLLKSVGELRPPEVSSHRVLPVFELEQGRHDYLEKIQTALKRIGTGESYQVCLSNRIRCRFNGDPFQLYRTLRRRNPAPFSAFLNFSNFAVLSSSPERFLRIDPNGDIEARPIKGTISRSHDPLKDRRLSDRLRSSEKNRSENLMIVDLLRNDLSRVAEVGSVHAPSLMAIESYATVHHIVSSVQAKLSTDYDAIDCIKAAFPGGSMTGAPKLRTMEIIDELEASPRGIYSGALGYLSLTGAVDLSIVIRTIVAEARSISIGTGGAIVSLSNPEEEYEEMLLKARALIMAISEYYQGDQRPFRYTIDHHRRMKD